MQEFLERFYKFIHDNDEDYLFDYEQLIEDFTFEWKQEETFFPIMQNIYSKEIIRQELFKEIDNFSQWHEKERERIINTVHKLMNE